jgi:chorismate synthase
MPANISINTESLQKQLSRRRPGQSPLTTSRQEEDKLEFLSGLDKQFTTLGSPLAFLVKNHDQRPEDYQAISDVFRPSHGDYTYWKKYQRPQLSGGGRASARETIARVAAGHLAEQFLQHSFPGLKIIAFVDRVGPLTGSVPDPTSLSRESIDAQATRCCHPHEDAGFQDLILAAKASGDSLGGTIRCIISGCPAGWGEPVFDKLEGDLAKAMLSIPACRGFEIGSGFAGTLLRGSEHNDSFVSTQSGDIDLASNRSGGIQAGISNGATIDFRLAFKAPATIAKAQDTVNLKGEAVTINPQFGRHDPCVLPRAVPIVEGMAALVLADHFLAQRAYGGFLGKSQS